MYMFPLLEACFHVRVKKQSVIVALSGNVTYSITFFITLLASIFTSLYCFIFFMFVNCFRIVQIDMVCHAKYQCVYV